MDEWMTGNPHKKKKKRKYQPSKEKKKEQQKRLKRAKGQSTTRGSGRNNQQATTGHRIERMPKMNFLEDKSLDAFSFNQDAWWFRLDFRVPRVMMKGPPRVNPNLSRGSTVV